MDARVERSPRLVVLWDLDGTLVDSEPLHEEALDKTLASYGVTMPEAVHDDVLGRDVEAEYALCVERFGIEAPFAEWIGRKYDFYFSMLARLQARPGAIELFTALRDAGVASGVVSNSDRLVVSANLTAVGLLVPAQVTVSRNDVREGKPSPESYLRGAYLLGGTAATTVVVEDSRTGASAGLAAGLTTLFWPQVEALATPEGAERIETVEALADRLWGLVTV